MSTKTLAIKVFHGDQLVDTQTLSQDVIKIGKLKSSHVCLDDETVARMHAVIEVSGDEVRVIDLGSATGTTLNGARIDKNAALTDGDVLTFGPYRLEVGFVRQAPVHVAAVAVAAPMHVTPAPLTAAPAPMMQRQAVQIDASEFEVQNGSRVAEVVAMYGNTVLDVQHVGQLKNKKSQAPMFLAIGGLMLVAGTGLFLSEVKQDWAGYQDKLAEANESGGLRPQKPGTGLGAFGVALALLGVVPFGFGLIRLSDYVNRSYTIGESHGASFHVPPQGLPDGAAFPLVRGSDHEFSLNFTQNMTGEVTFDGQSIPLGQLVSSGRAGSTGASYTFPLPPGANCRVKYNDVTFFVNSVAPGAVIKGGSDTDKPFWFYNGASFAVIGSLLVLTHLIPNEAGELSLDDMGEENRFVGYLNTPDKPPEEEEPPPEDQENTDEEAGGSGQRHKGEEGKMGKPTSKSKSGLYAMKGPKDAIPQMARSFDPEMAARQAGILGVMQQQSGHFLASPYGGAFAVGNDDADVWGGLTGTEIGEAYGVGGLGLVGTGRGGGGTGEEPDMMRLAQPSGAPSMQEMTDAEAGSSKTAEKQLSRASAADALDTTVAMNQPISLRTLFATTAYFNPEVVVGPTGLATIEIPMPENLTTFRVMAVAVDPDRPDHFGSAETQVKVRKPIMLRPSLPRFANFGDTFQASVMVDNQTDKPQAIVPSGK